MSILFASVKTFIGTLKLSELFSKESSDSVINMEKTEQTNQYFKRKNFTVADSLKPHES